jgi:transcriptional regulator with XRE-family HTH domain
MRGLTAKDVMLATKINDLGRFEKNVRNPSVDTLLSIAHFCNNSV